MRLWMPDPNLNEPTFICTVTQAAKGKLRPEAAVKAARFGGQTRCLWNQFTAMNNARMKAEGKFVFYAELSAMLPKLLKEDPKLAGLPHRCAQMQAKAFERTLKNYIRNKAEFQRIDAKRKARSAARVAVGLPPLKPHKSGIPQFKRYDDHADAFSFVGREARLETRPLPKKPGMMRADRIRLPKLGWLRVRGLTLPEDAILKQVAVTQEPTGWHVSLQLDGAAKEYKTPTLPIIGVDHGLTALAAWSEGEKIAPPKYARKAEKHIRRLNRQRDRRRKDSVKRRHTVARLAKAHRRVRNMRQDFLHKLTRRMVDKFEGFAVEDLNLKGLMKTRLAKSFADASLGELLRMLRYKAEWACREWRVLGRFERSTGVCPEPDCGWVGPRLRPGIDTWTCGGCGVVHDRDHAASRVILRDATVVRDAGVAPVKREPVRAFGRKRGSAVRGGIEVCASVSHDGSPPNDGLL
jgi:IS605 OrfB family transposase